jgi:predicted protein tyrosine phosphatase
MGDKLKTGRGGMADATDLKSVGQKWPCGFDSRRPDPAVPKMTTKTDQIPHKTLRQWCVRGVVLVLAGLAIWYVSNNARRWKDRFVPRKLRTVDPGVVYASGEIDRHLIRQVLTDDRIKVIVSLIADDSSDPDTVAEERTARELGIERFVDPLSGDGTGNIQSYADAITQVVEARRRGEPVLLHCSSGVQRSGGATFYYRVLVQHEDADSAAREMINNGFDMHRNQTLIPYLNAHMAEIAATLAERGVIDHVPRPLPQIDHE